MKSLNPNVLWYSTSIGNATYRFAFLYRPAYGSSAHLYTIGETGIKRHITVRPGKQTNRVCALLELTEKIGQEFIGKLDDEFFQALLIAVRGRVINTKLLHAQFARLGGDEKERTGMCSLGVSWRRSSS